MTKRRFITFGNMFLTLILCLTFDVVICKLSDTLANSSVVFKNIGIKLCQYKCVQSGFCRGLEYTIPTLTCHLSEMDNDTSANEAQYFIGVKDLANVLAGSCELKTCPNMRCLETRTGKTDCVKLCSRQNGENMTQAYAESNTTLLEASMVGDVARVKFILSDGQTNINSRDENKMTPVMHAAKWGHGDVFDLLVRKGARLFPLSYGRETILHLACIGGNVEIVKYILSHNIVGINSQDRNGLTPVMTAALYKRKDVFDSLVKLGADLLLKNEDGETILHVACEGGNVDIVKYLMKHDIVGIDSRSMNGWTPVMTAASEGHKDVFDVLVEAGADLSQVTIRKETILHASCMGGNVEIIRYLIKRDIVDIDSRNFYGWTPVLQAANGGQKDVFDVLVEAGADLSQVGNRKETILHVSCKGGNVDIIKYLVTRDIVDVDSRDADGFTPVMQAAEDGHKNVFDLLVEAGADLTLVNENREKILHMASGGGNVDIFKHLLSHVSADIDSPDLDGLTPVMHAAHSGHMDLFNFLVEKGADLSKLSCEGKNILLLATEGKNVEIIKYLLKRDIVDIDSRDKDDLTSVMHAAIDASKDVFDVLVKWGADLSLLDYENHNILHLACSQNSVEIVKYIITHNIVDINSRDGEECTPVMIAAREGHEAVFVLLVDHGADLSITNDVGDNILNMACKGQNVYIVKYVSTKRIAEGSYRKDDQC